MKRWLGGVSSLKSALSRPLPRGTAEEILLKDKILETLEQRSVHRCANELGKAILYSRALKGLESADSFHSIDFFRLASWALFDQLFAHAIKVLDPREKAGFAFLCDRYRDSVSEFCQHEGLELADIVSVALGLKLLRDKTHFHLDPVGVRDPDAIWSAASITQDQLDNVLQISFQVVCFLHELIRGQKFDLPNYDGTDAKRAAETAYQDRFSRY